MTTFLSCQQRAGGKPEAKEMSKMSELHIDMMNNAPLLSNFVSQSGAIVNMTSHLEATYQTDEITKEIKSYKSEYGSTWVVVWRVYYSDEDFLEDKMFVDSEERAKRIVRKTTNLWIDE